MLVFDFTSGSNPLSPLSKPAFGTNHVCSYGHFFREWDIAYCAGENKFSFYDFSGTSPPTAAAV